MREYKCVIFDVDGTILDTSEGLSAAVRYTIDKYNLPQPDDKVMKSFIGPPIQESFRKTYDVGDEIIAEMALTFRNHYKEYDLMKARPYDGIFDTMEILKKAGIKIAIATYKRCDYARKIVKNFGFDKYADSIRGSDFEGKLKKKDIIGLTLHDMDINNNLQALMVGDSDNDAIGAMELKMDCVAALYGFGFEREEDCIYPNIVACINKTTELIDFIRREK